MLPRSMEDFLGMLPRSVEDFLGCARSPEDFLECVASLARWSKVTMIDRT
jgi:hypothetical protein